MIITKDLVQLNLDASTKEEALAKLAKIAAEEGKVNNEVAFVDAVLKREEEYSTAVGFGVAIPHGKTKAVNTPFLMFTTFDSLDWKALDGAPVDMAFLIGVPENEAGSTHLKILAALSRKLMKENFRTGLRSQKTPEDVISFLEDSELGI